jgi:hypothetical protein
VGAETLDLRLQSSLLPHKEGFVHGSCHEQEAAQLAAPASPAAVPAPIDATGPVGPQDLKAAGKPEKA